MKPSNFIVHFANVQTFYPTKNKEKQKKDIKQVTVLFVWLNSPMNVCVTSFKLFRFFFFTQKYSSLTWCKTWYLKCPFLFYSCILKRSESQKSLKRRSKKSEKQCIFHAGLYGKQHNAQQTRWLMNEWIILRRSWLIKPVYTMPRWQKSGA